MCCWQLFSPVLCVLAGLAPAGALAALPQDAGAWLVRAAEEARTITGRGPGLIAALGDKGRLLAQAGGLASAAGCSDEAERWFRLAELCERALVHDDAHGPVTVALTGGLARAGRADEAWERLARLELGAGDAAAHAALAQALAIESPGHARAAALRAAADPAAVQAWAGAFAEADDFAGLERLAAAADLTDHDRAVLCARWAEALGRAGDFAAARGRLAEALILDPAPTERLLLALVGARAVLGDLTAAADAVDGLQAPALRVQGLARLAAGRAAAGDTAGAAADLAAAGRLVARFPDAEDQPAAVRALARVAVDGGGLAQTSRWIAALAPPRLRAAAALGVAESLSPPGQRSRMTRVLTLPASVLEVNAAPLAEAEPEAHAAVTAPAVDSPGEVAPASAPVVAADEPRSVATGETDAEALRSPAAHAASEPDAVAPAAEIGVVALTPAVVADSAGQGLNDAAAREIDQLMAELPGAPQGRTHASEPAVVGGDASATPPTQPRKTLELVDSLDDLEASRPPVDVPDAASRVPEVVVGAAPAARTAGDTGGDDSESVSSDIPVVAEPDLRQLANPDDAGFDGAAPDRYDARFITTRGAFTLRVERAWAPRAADRFYRLCRTGFYNNNRFFRVVPGFAVQWGIHGFPSVAMAWRNASIPDEPVRESNRRGTVSFAAAAVPNTRTTQVFVNLGDNAFLDELGFAPFAEVVQGMDVVEQLFSDYGEGPSQLQRRIQLEGNAFLDESYPELDGIVGVEVRVVPGP